MNGIFPHADPSICDRFFICADGESNLITCPPGLVFSLKTGACSWPEDAARSGCGGRSDADGFKCPARANGRSYTRKLFADPQDCQYFYLCTNLLEEPRHMGCPTATVFNDITESCDEPENVPEW